MYADHVIVTGLTGRQEGRQIGKPGNGKPESLKFQPPYVGSQSDFRRITWGSLVNRYVPDVWPHHGP